MIMTKTVAKKRTKRRLLWMWMLFLKFHMVIYHWGLWIFKNLCHFYVAAVEIATQLETGSNFHPGILKNLRIPWTLFWATTIKCPSAGTTVTIRKLNYLNPIKALQSSTNWFWQGVVETRTAFICLCLIEWVIPCSLIS